MTKSPVPQSSETDWAQVIAKLLEQEKKYRRKAKIHTVVVTALATFTILLLLTIS